MTKVHLQLDTLYEAIIAPREPIYELSDAPRQGPEEARRSTVRQTCHDLGLAWHWQGFQLTGMPCLAKIHGGIGDSSSLSMSRGCKKAIPLRSQL